MFPLLLFQEAQSSICYSGSLSGKDDFSYNLRKGWCYPQKYVDKISAKFLIWKVIILSWFQITFPRPADVRAGVGLSLLWEVSSRCLHFTNPFVRHSVLQYFLSHLDHGGKTIIFIKETIVLTPTARVNDQRNYQILPTYG